MTSRWRDPPAKVRICDGSSWGFHWHKLGGYKGRSLVSPHSGHQGSYSLMGTRTGLRSHTSPALVAKVSCCPWQVHAGVANLTGAPWCTYVRSRHWADVGRCMVHIVVARCFHQFTHIKEIGVFSDVRILLIPFFSLEFWDFLPWKSMTNRNSQFVLTFWYIILQIKIKRFWFSKVKFSQWRVRFVR